MGFALAPSNQPLSPRYTPVVYKYLTFSVFGGIYIIKDNWLASKPKRLLISVSSRASILPKVYLAGSHQPLLVTRSSISWLSVESGLFIPILIV